MTHNEYPENERLPPANVVTGRIRSKSSEECTSLVHRDDVGLRQIQLGGVHLRETEFLNEGWQGQSRANEGTVVADHACCP